MKYEHWYKKAERHVEDQESLDKRLQEYSIAQEQLDDVSALIRTLGENEIEMHISDAEIEFDNAHFQIEHDQDALEQERQFLNTEISKDIQRLEITVDQIKQLHEGSKYGDQFTIARSECNHAILELKLLLKKINDPKTIHSVNVLQQIHGNYAQLRDRIGSYLGNYTSPDVSYAQEKTDKALQASATNSFERAEHGALEIALMSDLSNSFTSMLPQKRQTAIGTAYAKAPKYIVAAINQHSKQLSYIRNTVYLQDKNGHFILNEYGQRIKEGCHYSPEKKYIAMDDEMTDAEYADVIQHELGHFIDDVLGWPSMGKVFSQAFSDAVSRYNADTLDGRRLLNDMLDDAFSTGAAYDRNITDIISALTINNPIVVKRFSNECVAYYGHDDPYWNHKEADGTDSERRKLDGFANVFAIITANYRISNNFVERWFPELAIALKQCIGGTE